MRKGALLTLATGLTGVLILSGCSTASVNGGGGGGGESAGLTPAPVCETTAAPAELGALPDAPDESVSGTVTLWGWYNVAPESTTDLMRKYYPNVEVKYEDFSVQDTVVKLQTALNAGTGAPNLAMVQDKDLPSVWGAGLYDLSDCLAPYSEAFPEFKWDRVTRADGAQVAAPWEINPGMVTYRRDVFEKYGIDAESIETWDDYIAAGKKVVESSGGEIAWTESNSVDAGNGTSDLGTEVAFLLNQGGGSYFDKDGNATFDSKAGVQALELIKRFQDEGLTAPDFGSKQAELDALRDGEIATFIGPASSRFFLAGSLAETSGDWGLMQLPSFGEGEPRGAVDGGTSIVMPAMNEDTEAAWAFLRVWLLSVEGRYASFEAGQLIENVFLPAAEDPRFQAGDPFYGGDSFLGTAIASAVDAPPAPSSPKLAKSYNALVAGLPSFMQGKQTAQDLAAQVQSAGQ